MIGPARRSRPSASATDTLTDASIGAYTAGAVMLALAALGVG
jgi:hypothetical protein